MSAEQRVYPVRKEAVAKQMQEAYTAKLEANKAAGRAALESGQFTPFSGFNKEKFQNLFVVSFELDQDTQDRVEERVIAPMDELAKEYSIPLVLAGREDIPPHLTLLNSPFINVPEWDQAEMNEWLASSSSHLNPLAEILTGLTFHMDETVIGPASYICASKFDAEQGAPYRAKKIVQQVIGNATSHYERTYGAPFPGSFMLNNSWDNIFHLSTARFTDNKVSGDAALAFADEVDRTVGQGLREDPLAVTVSNVRNVRAADVVGKYKPELLVS